MEFGSEHPAFWTWTGRDPATTHREKNETKGLLQLEKGKKKDNEKQEQNYLVDPIRLAHNQECLNWVTYIGIWNGEQEDKERDGNLEIAYKRSQWADIATASEVKNGFLQKQSN